MPDPVNNVSTANPITPAVGEAGTANSASAAAPQTAVSVPGADLVDVAQTEALLQSIIQAANAVPGIDPSKVAELKQAVASGTYQANPQALAQKIVELEALLVTAGRVR
ncbi:MAG TPA: flagellar biosynthesis anti-sigma factor FlgM [Stellaceae bacterium]|nr:flagellar biosynthesis anti-sigma factor FlgM [Stellaceae bacterium]